MRYNLVKDYDQLMSALITYRCRVEQEYVLADFQWLLVTLNEAIVNELPAEIRYDAYFSDGRPDIRKGIITSADIEFEGGVDRCEISLILSELTTGNAQTISHIFNASEVEENTFSNPDIMLKYYLTDITSDSMVTIITRARRL